MVSLSFRHRLLIAWLVTLVLIWVVAAYEIVRSQRETEQAAELRTATQARIFAEYSRSSIKRLNELLLDVRSYWTGDWRKFSDVVQHRQETLEDIAFQVAIIDPDGIMAFSNLAKPTDRVDLSTREHFTVHRDHPREDRLYISKPLKGKVSGKWSIQFTRPIFKQDRFAGVIVVSVSPELFSNFAGQLHAIEGSVMAMVRDTGEIMARSPVMESRYAQVLSSRPYLTEGGALSGNLRRRSEVDGQERILGYSKLPELGLIFLVGEPVSEALASHQQYLWSVLLIGSGVSLGLTLLFYGLHRSLTSLERLRHELVAEKERAETANEAKSRFLATMSHEIRTPMNGIIGMTDLLLETPLQNEQRQFLGIVKTSSLNLLNILNDVLDFSKLEAGRLEVEQIPFDLYALVSEVLKLHALPAHQKGLELVCNIQPLTPRYLTSDSGRIRQILSNLVGNAVKFTERGEVEVLVEVLDPKAKLATLVIAVRDTGIGVAPEKQQVIFDAFSQADTSTTRRFGGTGLGLSISTRLVHLLRGHISIESALAQGSTFRVELPVSVETRAVDHQQELAVLSAKRILIVEAHRGQRNIGLAWSEAWGLQIRAVDSGDAAVHLLSTPNAPHFDLVLLAADAIDANGLEVIARIRAQPHLAQLPIVLMVSSLVSVSEADKAALGIADVLFKPVGPHELMRAFCKALQPSLPSPALAPPRDSVETVEPAISPTTPSSSGGLRVLLAEDHEVNRLLVEALMRKWGHQLVCVENGEQAVARTAHERFDLVLMDIHMPGMGGIEATRWIRVREKRAPEQPRLLIVALTASALTSERELALQSGFDAYLTKPIVQSELREVFDSVSAGQLAAQAGDLPAPQAEDGTDHAQALQSADAEVVAIIGPAFLAKADSAIVDIQRAFQAGDRQNLAQLAHAQRGVVGNFGARSIEKLLRALEETSDDFGPLDQAVLDQLTREWRQLCAALRQHIAGGETS